MLENLQVEMVKKKLQRHLDNGDQALIVEHGIYTPDNTVLVTFTKLYPHFALGYVLNKAAGLKTPYTLLYNDMIAHVFDDASQWDNGDNLYD